MILIHLLEIYLMGPMMHYPMLLKETTPSIIFLPELIMWELDVLSIMMLMEMETTMVSEREMKRVFIANRGK